MRTDTLTQFPRRHPVWTVLMVALLLLILLFDWNWFKGPVERYVSRTTERSFSIGDLHVRLGFSPTVRMRDVHFGNADWSQQGPMARIEQLEFSISLRSLPDEFLLPRVALTRPDFIFERLADGRRNWSLAGPSEQAAPGRLRISTLSVDQGRLQYFEHGVPFALDVQASTFDPQRQEAVTDATAAPVNNRYSTRYQFAGEYRGAAFSGSALTGEVISFQKSGVPFPIKGALVAGSTRLELEGTLADAFEITSIDTQLRIQGRTMANLYPFLLLPLPASPPYALQGRLILKGDTFTFEDLTGKIGSSDVQGRAEYVEREPRPMLTVDLRSRLLKLGDLGPLIGVQTKDSDGKPAISQAQTATRGQAAQEAARSSRILPDGSFEGSRLKQIDADVQLVAQRLDAPGGLPLENLRATMKLRDAVLTLEPVELNFAGGMLSMRARLDARQPILHSEVRLRLQRARMERLLPSSPELAKSAGMVGADLNLSGSGNSIADAAAKSQGEISAVIGKGKVSNLLDAVSGLNFGKVLALKIGGDREIAVNCGAAVFDVRNGRGTARVFVVDTQETQILSEGGFDLENERIAMTVTPMPKEMGILSLRTPIRLHGTFRNPEYELEKAPMLARAAGALALAAVAPWAALLPLIETGPGEDSDCARTPQAYGGARPAESRPEAPRPSAVPANPMRPPGASRRENDR